ncbi:MAG: hypothetical protein UR54_C0027G0002 [Candidatus Roizmanbacteria bacterium GW2011_GWA2_34_18]|uniref:Uncharacterized protein n=1 Tax=Candidatus Roizmanbacteria bacterium GW2011_GWA2_34_18 TaxID=1618477 RepID=A0A0G0D875_9BACT|nr:MAG: hypothetical protein UR54_C0027G0002 [Candidatus Roizmanbacteria bacterium GW2011_GWA2_34_18]
MMKVFFNKKQLDRLSEFFSNISIVFLASIVSPVFIGNKLSLDLLVLGIILTSGFLLLSLLIY